MSGCTSANGGGWPFLKPLWWWKLKLFPLRKAIGEQERFREDRFDDPKDGKQLRTTEWLVVSEDKKRRGKAWSI